MDLTPLIYPICSKLTVISKIIYWCTYLFLSPDDIQQKNVKTRSRDDKFSTDKPLLFSLSLKSLPISAQILRVHNGLFKGPAPGFNMPKTHTFSILIYWRYLP